MRAFSLTERDLGPRCREIRIEGELDLAVVDRMSAAIDRCAAESDQIVISLERCEFIDSTGIASIVRAHNQLDAEGCRVVVCAPSNQVLRVLTVTGLTSNGMVFESVDDALASSPE